MPKQYRIPNSQLNAATPDSLFRISRIRASFVICHSDLSLTRGRFERGFLGLEELPDARPAQNQHLAELAVVERGFFPGALQLDEFPGLGHSQVKVHLRRH